jgi:uncharacterized phage-associated protein
VTTAHDVAAYIVARRQGVGRPVDKLQLQKLLYLVAGAHHVLWRETAFRDEFRAYQRGPVIRGVEQTYRGASTGATPILVAIGGHPDAIGLELQQTVELILEAFGDRPGVDLENYVKQPGSPWRVARGDLPDGASSDAVIDYELIRAWSSSHPVLDDVDGPELPESALLLSLF